MNDVKDLIIGEFENHLRVIILAYNELKESFTTTNQLVSSDLQALDLILSFLVNYKVIRKYEFLDLLTNFRTCLKHLRNDASLNNNKLLNELLFYINSLENNCFCKFDTVLN